MNLQIKQGQHTALKGVYETDARKLNIKFNYNRSFSGNCSYPDSGSWTTTLRPDYTLSFWPCGISENEAETQELIVHVHFDAKYKIANLPELIEQNIAKDLDLEKVENKKGIYKNADLIKMHAYRDAIRRTSGAYVLYPGDKKLNRKGFHEIIPGLGAFPVRPSKNDSGISELKSFILEIIQHFVNRASHREKIAYRMFDVYRTKPSEVKEELGINLIQDLNLKKYSGIIVAVAHKEFKNKASLDDEYERFITLDTNNDKMLDLQEYIEHAPGKGYTTIREGGEKGTKRNWNVKATTTVENKFVPVGSEETTE